MRVGTADVRVMQIPAMHREDQLPLFVSTPPSVHLSHVHSRLGGRVRVGVAREGRR